MEVPGRGGRGLNEKEDRTLDTSITVSQEEKMTRSSPKTSIKKKKDGFGFQVFRVISPSIRARCPKGGDQLRRDARGVSGQP